MEEQEALLFRNVEKLSLALSLRLSPPKYQADSLNGYPIYYRKVLLTNCLAFPSGLYTRAPNTMSTLNLHHPWQLLLLLLLRLCAAHLRPPTPATCHPTCGTLPVKYPFGTGPGCGHPAFATYIKCSSAGTLQFSTAAGVYTVESIDYPSSTVIITDPLMSNCTSMQNSGSFSLDRSSPFTLAAATTFALLGCSATSPIFDKREEFCDTGSGSLICRGLYSCQGVAGIGLAPDAPVSSCCVYEPDIVLGSGFGLDLPKLQCSSYSAIYGFGGHEGEPMKWEYGISLQYNGSYYSESCKNCEDSGGLCGFAGADESFACICSNGVNTTNNCLGRGYAWSGTQRPTMTIEAKMRVGGYLLLWLMMKMLVV